MKHEPLFCTPAYFDPLSFHFTHELVWNSPAKKKKRMLPYSYRDFESRIDLILVTWNQKGDCSTFLTLSTGDMQHAHIRLILRITQLWLIIFSPNIWTANKCPSVSTWQPSSPHDISPQSDPAETCGLMVLTRLMYQSEHGKGSELYRVSAKHGHDTKIYLPGKKHDAYTNTRKGTHLCKLHVAN